MSLDFYWGDTMYQRHDRNKGYARGFSGKKHFRSK